MEPRIPMVIVMLAMSILSFLEPRSAAGADVDVPEVGTMAPDVTLHDQDGAPVTLSELWARGPLVVYFYPKDQTPGCTAQACSFRDASDDLVRAGLQVVGVSLDTVESHQKFATKRRLSFPLLADTDGEAATAYGVKSTFMGFPVARRVTFLIDPSGEIRNVWDPARATDHADQILEWVREQGVLAEAG
jgi:thioredoxin-dependent peroxiredoxin